MRVSSNFISSHKNRNCTLHRSLSLLNHTHFYNPLIPDNTSFFFIGMYAKGTSRNFLAPFTHNSLLLSNEITVCFFLIYQFCCATVRTYTHRYATLSSKYLSRACRITQLIGLSVFWQ